MVNFPSENGLLSAEELQITNSSATDLTKKLAVGQLKSVDVTLAFCKRAALAHQLVSLYAFSIYCRQEFIILVNQPGKLCPRVLSRAGSSPGQRAR